MPPEIQVLLQNPLVMFAIMGVAAGWIAAQIVGVRHGTLSSYLVTGIIGSFVGGYVTRYFNLDLMKIGNPQLEQLAMATIGAIIVVFMSRIIARDSR